MNGYSAIRVGNALIDEAAREGSRVSPMKLQKLAYYAHGWQLAIEGVALIDEGVEAWQYGPVVKSLYHEFKGLGSKEIERRGVTRQFVDNDFVTHEPTMGSDHAAYPLIEKIWMVYGKYTAVQLSNATHAEGTPWREVSDRFEGDIPPNVKIPDEIICEHFKKRLELK